MQEKVKNNLTDKPKVTYSNSMPEDLDSKDRSVPETGSQSLASPGQSVEDAFSSFDANFRDVLSAKLEQIAKENSKKEPQKADTEKVKETAKSDTDKKNVEESPEDIEAKLTKKEKRLVSRIVKALDPTQKASFFNRLKFALKGSAYEDLSEVVKEEEMLKSDYKPKTVKEIGNPESFKRFVGNGGGMRDQYDTYVNGLVRRLRDEGIDDEKVLEVRKHAEADYAQNIQNIKKVLEETGDYKKVRTKLSQLGGNFNRFDTYIDYLKHDDIVDPVVYQDLAKPLEELPEVPQEIVVEKVPQEDLIENNIETTKVSVEETVTKEDLSVSAYLQDERQDKDQLEANGKFKIDPEVVKENAMLADEDRIKKASEVLGVQPEDLTAEQQQAILQAHYIGVGEKGKDRKENGEETDAHIYNYTQAQLKEKSKILKNAHFSADQRRVLMEHGITGGEYGNESEIDRYNRAQGIETPQTSTSGSMFRDEDGKLKSADEITADSQPVIQKAVGTTYEDDINTSTTSSLNFETGGESETYALQGILGSPDTFNFKMVRRMIGKDLEKLHQWVGKDRDVDQTIGQVGALLVPLAQQQQEAERVEVELEGLRFQMSQGTDPRTQEQYRDLLVQQDQIRRSGWELAREAVEHLGNSYGKQSELRLDPGEEERPSNPRGNQFDLRGRTEREGDEEAIYGRSVSSIEDIGYFMEKLVAEYEGKIMVSLYRVGNGDQAQIVSDQDPYWNQFGNEDAKKIAKEKHRLYAFNLGKDEYARDYDNGKLPDHIKNSPGERGNKVLMLTVEEIADKYKECVVLDESGNIKRDSITGVPTLLSRDEQAQKATRGRSRQKQITTDFWEPVKVIRPDQYMNWMRYYWDYLHNDDPDNPANFFQGVIVNHPDQRGQVNAEMMHKGAGTYLRSKFLTDPATGNRRVFNEMKNEIINEMWVPSTERNNEVLYKKIMHADEELPKVVRDQVVAGNLLAKNAAGGRNTLATFFSLPERFHDEFDYRTGESLSKEDKENTYDSKLGNAILLAYQIYYNIGDYDGLEKLLGNNASIFTREAIARATLQEMGELTPANLDESHYSIADSYLKSINKDTTVLDDGYYKDGRVDQKGKDFKEWMTFINPFYPVQKDTRMLAVIRRMVRNQMQEIVHLNSNDGLAELHAYLRTYHDGLAARHDTGMGNRNAQTKYEFIEAYQDKQSGRDRAGNKYNKGVVKRTIVGMLHGMPTRNGETVQDILENVINTQMDTIREYHNLLTETKRQKKSELEGIMNDYRNKIDTEQSIEDLEENIRAKLQEAIAAKKLFNSLPDSAKTSKEQQLWQQKREDIINEAIELKLRNENQELSRLWETYNNEENMVQRNKRVNEIFGRLDFDEAQYTQYGGMHYSNGTALFLEEMESHDMPLDEIRGRDSVDGKVYFKTEKFGPWLEGMEKRMRYTIETWPLPLGAMERRLINPRGKGVPKYIDMPLVESIFGSHDSRVFRMAQDMALRQYDADKAGIEKKRKELNDKIKNKMTSEDEREKYRRELRNLENPDMDNYVFTDGQGNIITKKLKRDSQGKIVKDETGKPRYEYDYEDDFSKANRKKLRGLVGYIDYETDEEGRIVGEGDYKEAVIDDPAKLFTRAYVKVRIANFLWSHTDKKTPYEKWTVEQREDFLRALELTNYFSAQDVEDIRRYSGNTEWGNFKAETRKNMRKALPEGIWAGLKELAGGIFKD